MSVPKSNDDDAFTRVRVMQRCLAAISAALLCVGGLGAVSAPSESGTGQVEATEQSQANQHRPEWLIPLPSPEPEKKWSDFEGQFESLDDCSDAVLKDLLGATDEQWELIRPRLKQLEEVRRRTRSTLGVVIIGGGGSGASGGSGSSGGVGPAARGGASGRAYGGSGGSGRYRRGSPMRQRSSTARRPPRPAPRRSPGYTSQWNWWRPSQSRRSGQVTPGERLCEELLDVIAARSTRPEQLHAKMEQLNAYRKQADGEIRAAREALREVVTRRQEAMLILMGHLE
jgi:hypothetical protein